MKKCEHVLFENNAAVCFNEAYPIGNGKLGGMVYGDPRHMRLGLNHDELWAGYRSDSITKTFDLAAFREVQRLTFEGKYREAQDLFEAKYAVYDGAGYLTLGNLFIDFEDGEVSDYKRSLDIRDSVAAVEFKLNGKAVKVEYIASNPRGALIVNVSASEPLSMSVYPEFEMQKAVIVKGKRITAFGECENQCPRQKNRSLPPPDIDDHGGVRFAAAVDVKTEGDTRVENDKIFVTASDVTVAVSCETTYKDGREYGKDNYKELLASYMDAALKDAYSVVKAEHTADVRALFDRVRFTIDSPDTSDVPTSERIKDFADGKEDNSLVVLQFNMGRYFLIAASRPGSRATNLQGIWNDKMDAPWCSNYTTNINTEMNYWPALPCSMPELLDPLETQIRIIAEEGRKAAKDLYGASGIASSHNSDIFGQVTPSCGWIDWSYFPLSFAWLLRELYNKYEYTLDKDYLESIYELIEGAAEFVLTSLTDDGEYLIMTPGTSAENKYFHNGTPTAVARSTTFFASIARESVEHYIAASEILGKTGELLEKARESLPKMLPLRITDDGRIEEWYFGGKSIAPEECEPHHRHISHLYDLYPTKKINKTTPELYAAARRSLEVRGDDATGWSLGWKINCYAALSDGDGVMRLTRMFLRPIPPEITANLYGGGVYPNLMCAHPPFQIDGNFGFAAAICEMLVGEENGKPVPAPALPKEFKSGSIKGVAVKGAKHVDMAWQDGTVTEFKVY